MWLAAAAWPVADTSSPAPEPLYHLNHHDQRARIAFVCFYNDGDVACVRALQICQAQ
jgi:hypothetical protein